MASLIQKLRQLGDYLALRVNHANRLLNGAKDAANGEPFSIGRRKERVGTFCNDSRFNGPGLEHEELRICIWHFCRNRTYRSASFGK